MVMEQLQPCRFTEADRNKRRVKDVGCIGVECKHCAGQVDSRKFFWSSVNAVESNFVSVHTHMLECRMVPEPLKEHLRHLKQLRKVQTAELMTGSQKAFFRRVWDRLHKEEIVQQNQQNPKPSSQEEGDSLSMEDLAESDKVQNQGDHDLTISSPKVLPQETGSLSMECVTKTAHSQNHEHSCEKALYVQAEPISIDYAGVGKGSFSNIESQIPSDDAASDASMEIVASAYATIPLPNKDEVTSPASMQEDFSPILRANSNTSQQSVVAMQV